MLRTGPSCEQMHAGGEESQCKCGLCSECKCRDANGQSGICKVHSMHTFHSLATTQLAHLVEEVRTASATGSFNRPTPAHLVEEVGVPQGDVRKVDAQEGVQHGRVPEAAWSGPGDASEGPGGASRGQKIVTSQPCTLAAASGIGYGQPDPLPLT